MAGMYKVKILLLSDFRNVGSLLTIIIIKYIMRKYFRSLLEQRNLQRLKIKSLKNISRNQTLFTFFSIIKIFCKLKLRYDHCESSTIKLDQSTVRSLKLIRGIYVL